MTMMVIFLILMMMLMLLTLLMLLMLMLKLVLVQVICITLLRMMLIVMTAQRRCWREHVMNHPHRPEAFAQHTRGLSAMSARCARGKRA